MRSWLSGHNPMCAFGDRLHQGERPLERWRRATSENKASVDRLPPVIARALADAGVRAAIVAAADFDTLWALRQTNYQFKSDVDCHLFKEVGHVQLRPTTRVDYRQDVIALSASGPNRIGTVAWWQDEPPQSMFLRTKTVTLPARRAGAALSWLYGRPEVVSPPIDPHAAQEDREDEDEEFDDPKPSDDEDLYNSEVRPWPSSSLAASDAGEDPESEVDEENPWDFVPSSPSSSPSTWDLDDLTPEGETELENMHFFSDAADFVPVWYMQETLDFRFPPIPCTLNTVVLDCLKVDLEDISATEIAGVLPTSVDTVVLRTRPRIELRRDREELLCMLRYIDFPLNPAPSNLGVVIDYPAPETDAEGPRHWAMEGEKHIAFHTPALAGEFRTLVLNLTTMHPDALLDISLVIAPLERIVVICGLGSWSPALRDAWGNVTEWTRRPDQEWGVLHALLSRYAETNIRIDIVDAARVDAPPQLEVAPDVEQTQDTVAITAVEQEGGQPAVQDQEENVQVADAEVAPFVSVAFEDIWRHPVGMRLGCEYGALPRAAHADEDFVEDDKITADIRYLDSRKDVGPGQAISSAEWKLWTTDNLYE